MNTFQNTNAIIIDDHSMFAESLSAILGKFNIFNAIYTYKTEEDVTNFFFKKSIYDQTNTLIFVDYYMPEKNGISLIKEVRKMDKKIKIVFLSSVANPMVIHEILSVNPNAIVNKTEGVEQVLKALKHIENNEQYLSDFTKEILKNQVLIDSPLSSREIELLNFFAKGITTEKIAEALYISPLTVMTHKRNMMKKTTSKTLLELIAFARKNGLID